MVADSSSFDGGTAYLTIQPKLSDDFEADLATMVEAVPPMSVSLAADLDKFAQDLDKQWKDLDHKLALQLDPQLDDNFKGRLAEFTKEPISLAADLDFEQAANQLEAFRMEADKDGLFLSADLDFERADVQLADFRVAVGTLDIPVVLNLDHAFDQLALLRAEAAQPLSVPVIMGTAPAGGVAPAALSPAQGSVGTPQDLSAARLKEQRDKEDAAIRSEREMDAAQRRAERQYELRDAQPNDRPGIRLDHSLEDADIRREQREQDAERRRSRSEDDSATKAARDAPAAQAKAAKEAAAAQKKAQDEADAAAKKAQQDADQGWRDFINAGKEAGGLSFESLLSQLDKVGSKLEDLGKKTLKWGSLGGLLGGGIVDLGAAAVVGMLGAHGVMSAFEDQKAVSEEQRDPEAQLDRQAKIRGAADQVRQSNEGLSEATYKVSDANTAAKLSSMALADAYKEVGREVRDAKDALTDAQLAEEGSALGVAGARQHLMQDLTSGSATPLDIETDVFGVQSANQKFSESQKKTSDQQVDTQETLQRGVTGSPTIIQATQANADAQHGVALALQGVHEAEISVSEAAIAMHRALMPTEAENKLNIELGKLAPNARDFVTTVHNGVMPAVHDLSQTVSQNLFAGLGESLVKTINDQMPAMKSGFGQLATDLNGTLKDIFSQLDSMFSDMEKSGEMKQFVTSIGDALQGIAPLIAGLAKGLIDLGTEMGPHLGDLFAELGSFLSSAGKPLGELGGALADALTEIGPELPDLLTNLGDLATQILPPLADALTEVAPALSMLAQNFSDLFYWVDKAASALDGLFGTGDVQHLPSWVGTLGSSLPGVGPLINQFSSSNSSSDSSSSAPSTSDSNDSFAGGGHVVGAGGPRDDAIDAKLSNGEFVVNAQATSQHRGTLEAINAGAYASGGYVSSNQQQKGHLGKDAQKEAVRQTRKRTLGFQDGGYVDDGGGSGDYSFGGTNSSTPGDYSFGGGSSGTGGEAQPMMKAATPAPTTAQPSAATPSTSSSTAATGQGFPATWQADGATGGPVNAVGWARNHLTTPYIWGGTSADGADCSGWVGDLQQVAMGTPDPTGRLGTTANVLDGTWPGFITGASKSDMFVIGANDHHMVASILGVDVEERQSGEDARVGDNAASPWDSQFTTLGHVDPSMFVPAFNDPKTATNNQTGTGGGTTGTTGNSTTGTNAADNAIANQSLPVTMPVPQSWSSLPGQLLNRGASQLWWGDMSGATNAANGKPGSTPALTGGLHGSLQNVFQGWVNNAPKDQQSAWSTFLLGPNLAPHATPNAQKGPNSTAGLTGLGSNGGLLGIMGTALMGNQQIKGLTGLLGEGIGFELQPIEKAVGWSDTFQGSPAALWKAGNDIQADNEAAQMASSTSSSSSSTPPTPTSGDPSTTGPNATTHGATAASTKPTSSSTSSSSSSQTNKMAMQGGGLPPLHTYDPDGGVQQWAATFGQVLGALGMPNTWTSLGLAQMQTESGGNPKAINDYDSNAAAGTPSKGLMQVIDPTFAAEFPKFAGKGFPDDIWDPRSNIAAGLEWTVEKYGTPEGVWGQGHGYADGGDVWGDGSSDSDSIRARLSNGEFVVNADSSDAYRPMLHLINKDRAGTMAPKSMIPTRELLSSSAVTSHVDNSTTYHAHGHDLDSSMKALRLKEAQRAAKADTYLGRWRNYRGL